MLPGKKRKLILGLIILIFSLVGLIATFTLVKKPKKEIPSQAAAQSLDINYFKTSFQAFLDHFGSIRRIANFSGTTDFLEFDDEQDDKTRVFAGHLGPFFAPPFYSVYNINNTTPNWRGAFNVGLAFYNRYSGQGTAEESSDPTTEAFWYLSKLEITKNYTNKFHARITGKKIAIPGYRALGLKIKVEDNYQPASENINLLFLTSIPTIRRLDSWPETQGMDTWNWKPQPSSDSSGQASKYDEVNKAIIYYNPNQRVYLAVGLNENPTSWQTDNSSSSTIYYQFINSGVLTNTNSDTETNGTSIGLSYNLPALNFGESKELTLLVTIGETENEVIRDFNALKVQNIEALADNFWNKRLNDFLTNSPRLQTDNQTLEKIYYNSLMNLMINKWEGFKYGTPSIILPPFYAYSTLMGETTAEYFWSNAPRYSQFLSLVDPSGTKDQIKKFLSLDLSRCRAYNPLPFGSHVCDLPYSFDRWSLARTIYDYSTTVDFAFLEETVGGKKVIDYFKEIVEYWDNKAGGADKLADFGDDCNLYEFNIHCNLGGKYNGYVPAPNAERYDMHQMAADLYQKLGEPALAQASRNKASQIKSAVNSLWNDQAGWFDSIALYDCANTDVYCQTHTCTNCSSACLPRDQPLRNTMWAVGVSHLLDFDGLLNDNQKQKIINNLKSKFFATYGLTSLPKGETWCTRGDWHGPGIYSGEAGHILTAIFKTGAKNDAYDLLVGNVVAPGYSYLAEIPYWGEVLGWDKPLIPGAGVERYGCTSAVEGASFAQAIVKGMFGISMKENIPKIAPNIPSSLNNITLSNIKLQNHLFDVQSANNEQYLTMRVGGNSPSNNFQFFYQVDNGSKTVHFTINHLLENNKFDVRIINTATAQTITKSTNSDVNGEIKFDQSLNGENKIISTPTATLPFKIKFQGITVQGPDKTVRVILKQGEVEKYHFDSVAVNSDAAGVYSGNTPEITPGAYEVFIKGPAHLQKKFGSVNINSGMPTQDWSATPLLAGDVWSQPDSTYHDNKITTEDIISVLNMWTDFSVNVPPNTLQDLNGDNKITNEDIRTLLVNYNLPTIYGQE